MKVLVTGATGFVGQRLISSLVERSHDVIAFALQDDSPAVALFQRNVEVKYGDIRDQSSIEKALNEVEAVINLAAVQESNDQKLNEEVNYKGVKNLIGACKKRSTRRLIHLSSIATCYKNKNYYGKSKEKADQYVMNKSDMDYTIIRPTLIYGDCMGGPFHTFIKTLEILPFIIPVIGNGKALKRPIFVDDVVSAVILSLELEIAIGKYYNISGRDIVSVEKMIKRILARKGIKKLIVKIPVWILYPFAFVLEMFFTNPPFTRASLITATQDGILDHSLIRDELGFRPVSFEEGLAKTGF
ncbi:MAG: NAD-dependent epimerase/dehydratase family protein [Candidatus Scalinduaceae bacterium]